MHKIKILTICIAVAALTLIGTVPSFGAENNQAETALPETDGTSVILMDAKSGEILYEKNAYEKRDPASITKILNCLVVLDTLDLNREVTIDFEPETEGSVMKLKKGEKLTVKDLVYGMMLWSGNDAAEALARFACDGDINRFCSLMNEKAREMGGENTAYTNPNGLNPEGKVNNITTAYDIAVIVRKAMQNPEFAEIVSTPRYTVAETNKSEKRKMVNSDRCLYDTKTKVEIEGKEVCLKYDGCKGVKTGYSSTAGDCFAGYAERGNTHLIAVVLNASHEIPKFRDTIELWDYGFANFKTYTVAEAKTEQMQLRVRRGSLRSVALGLDEDFCVTIGKKEKGKNTITSEAVSYEDKVEAPVVKGKVLGYIIAKDRDGNEIGRKNLVALESARIGGPLSYIGIADEDMPLFFVIVATGAILVLVIIIVRKTGKKSAAEKEQEE